VGFIRPADENSEVEEELDERTEITRWERKKY
jgi:hypothetical protein